MKNRYIKILFIIILGLIFSKYSLAEEFIFEVTNIEITENGNVYKGKNRGKILTESQTEIISDNFTYLKRINRLEANGNVHLSDLKKNITVKADQIFYLKDEEKIYTVGKTIIISEKYNIEGFDMTLLKDKMILFSNKEAVISDNFSTIYKPSEFEFIINEEILKGKKIEAITNYQLDNSDKYFFEIGYFNLKKNEFLGKEVNIILDKLEFGNIENDPRINSVSGYGDEFNTYLEKGVFTSCKKTDKCPPWKLRSSKIHHDKVKKQINYKDAWLEIYDYPVAYFPKFFHPDPTVVRQSGFLKPELGSSKNLGNSIYTPYFYVISDDKDLTFKPRLFTNNKIVLQNEYRQKTKNSWTVADFSFTKGHDSSLEDKNDTRSHLFSKTLIDLGLENFLNSMLKIDFQKSSNDNYLKLFNLESPLLLQNNTVLESSIELNLIHEDYDLTTSFETYETLSGSNSDRYQYVLPSYYFSKNFDYQNIDGSFNFSSHGINTLHTTNITETTLLNDLNYTGADYFFNNGIKNNFEISLKNINGIGKNNPQFKSKPTSDIMSSYFYNVSLPLMENNQEYLNTLEPKISFRFSPHEMKNHETLTRRIDIENVFNRDRLSMSNSLEGGESMTIGLDFKKEKIDIKNEKQELQDYIDFKLATVLRLEEENYIPNSSTINEKNSNIFGQFNYKATEKFSFNYDFSLTNDLDTFNYNSITTDFTFDNFYTQFEYLEETGPIGNTHIIENITQYRISDDNTLTFKTRQNRDLNLTEYYDLIYDYKNDCLTASIQYKKNYYNDADIKPVEELFFSITIVPLTTFSPSKLALN
jgi:LPS-assembly protein